MSSTNSDNSQSMGYNCFLESLPGLINCSSQTKEGDFGTSDSEADGSIDIPLSDAIPSEPIGTGENGEITQEDINDFEALSTQYNIDTTKGQIGVAFTFAKEDLRNKLVLIESYTDESIVYAPLNSDIEINLDTTTAIVYEATDDVDPRYKYIRLYIPDAIQKFPRGTYVVEAFVNVPKVIANNSFDNWVEISTQRVTLKTKAIQGRLFNNKYLKTAFNRNVTGREQGVELKLDNRPSNITPYDEGQPVQVYDSEGNPTYIQIDTTQ